MKTYLLILFLVANVVPGTGKKKSKDVPPVPTVVRTQTQTVNDPLEAALVATTLNNAVQEQSNNQQYYTGRLFEISISTSAVPAINEVKIPKLQVAQ